MGLFDGHCAVCSAAGFKSVCLHNPSQRMFILGLARDAEAIGDLGSAVFCYRMLSSTIAWNELTPEIKQKLMQTSAEDLATAFDVMLTAARLGDDQP